MCVTFLAAAATWSASRSPWSMVRNVSTSTASCLPEISVAELATQLNDSCPDDSPRPSPGRLTVTGFTPVKPPAW
jgi:hypothetical protein